LKKVTLNTIRSQNLKTVFDIIANQNNITRSEIAKLSKLSLMTVSNIIEHLDRLDLVLHGSKEQTSAVGRKAELISVNRDSRKFVIMDLTTFNFTFVVLNLDLTVHYSFTRWRYERKDSYKENLMNFLSTMKQKLDARSLISKIIGIGVSVPGPYEANDDIVISKRVQDLMNIQLKALINGIVLESRVEDCDVFIDEDVKFAALANMTRVASYKNKTIYYMYIGEGVGGAIAVNGNVLRGASSFAGDIGQVLANENANFEELLSTIAFINEMPADGSFVDCNEDDTNFMEKLRLFKANHPEKFNGQLEKYCRLIAVALYNVLWFIDPHAVIIECEYASLNGKDFIEQLKAMLSKMLPVRHPIPDILLSNQSIKDAYMGAGLKLRDRWLESIS
jgi:predicted NBD/HSP70 family sugar kinase